MSTPASDSFFKQLIKRRVIQIVGVYLGATIAVMEFSGMLVERYAINDSVVDYLLLSMVILLPSVMVLAWKHGAPGKDDWGKAEKTVLPINLLALLMCLSWFSFSNHQPNVVNAQVIDASALPIESSDSPMIPKIGIMFFTPDNQLEDKWLSYALPYMIATQLRQNRQLVVKSSYDPNYFWSLQRAGFVDGLNVPMSLAKSVAVDADLHYFVRGTIKPTSNGYQLTLQLYGSKNSKLIAEKEIQATTIFKLAANATSFLQQQDFITNHSETLLNEIPVTDFITGNIAALKSFIEGKNAILLDNNQQQAIAFIKQAIELDPSFAQAYLELAEILISEGQLLESNHYLKKALLLNYKLTEPLRFSIKAAIYATEHNIPEQIAVYRTWIEMYPDDYLPKRRLALILRFKSDNLEEVARLYHESLQLNSAQPELYSRLGQVYEALGDLEQARSMYQQHRNLRPQSYLPLLAQGAVEAKLGNFAAAERLYQQASLTQVDKVTPILAMANIALRQGDIAKAEQRYRETEIIAQAPQQYSLYHASRIDYFFLQRQYESAYQELKRYQEVMSSYDQPIDTIFATHLSKMHIYAAVNRFDEASEHLTALENKVDDSMKNIAKIGRLFLSLYQKDSAAAKQWLIPVEESIEQFSLENLVYLATFSKAYIADLEGHTEEALKLYQQALAEATRFGGLGAELDAIIIESILRLNLKQQKFAESIELAENFLIKWPYHPDINFWLAKHYAENGNLEQQQAALARAQKIWLNADSPCQPCSEIDAAKTIP